MRSRVTYARCPPLTITFRPERYWNEPYFNALAKLQPVVERAGLTLAEVALRWVSHHSLMRREHGDAVIIGASSLAHIEQNLVDLEKGPLRACAAYLVRRLLIVHAS